MKFSTEKLKNNNETETLIIPTKIAKMLVTYRKLCYNRLNQKKIPVRNGHRRISQGYW